MSERITNQEFVADSVLRAQGLVASIPEIAWPITGMSGDTSVTTYTHNSPEQTVAAAAGQATVFQVLYPGASQEQTTEPDRAFIGVRSLDWVRAGDYEAFTECQPAAAKLTRETFDWLRQHTEDVLGEADDAEVAAEAPYTLLAGSVRAMEVSVSINDIGKVQEFQDIVRQLPGISKDVIDHDVLMLHGLSQNAQLSPSFDGLSTTFKEIILDGLRSGVNLAQFTQAESVPASLQGLEGIPEVSRKFHYLHSFYDVAGAAGAKVQNGSIVASEAMVSGYRSAIQVLEGIGEGKSALEVYSEYIAIKGEQFGIDVSQPTGYAVTRLSTMMRMSKPEQAAKVQGVFDTLPDNTQTILLKELNKNGVNDGIATLVYYAPAILLNLQAKAATPEEWERNITTGLTTIARLYQASRCRDVIRASDGNGVQTLQSSNVASLAARTPRALDTLHISFSGDSMDVEPQIEQVRTIDIDAFPQLESLADLPGERFAIVGMGGGSDGVQAAIFAKLLEGAGKSVPAVISIRSAKPQSQNPDGTVAADRTVRNHGGELADGVFRITPDSRGAGRFLEHLPAADVAMYLVTENGTDLVTDKLQTVLSSVGGVDTVIGLDTGGDVLYPPTSGLEAATTTPDQDIRSLNAIRALGGVAKYCMVVAPGIDSPPNAEEILQQNGAVHFRPNDAQTAEILDTYDRWQMDGRDGRYYGKTPLAWQEALKAGGTPGVVTLKLPQSVVTSDKNPWNPYVVSQPAMAGAFIMELD